VITARKSVTQLRSFLGLLQVTSPFPPFGFLTDIQMSQDMILLHAITESSFEISHAYILGRKSEFADSFLHLVFKVVNRFRMALLGMIFFH
jgi:hypothetical protein